MKTYVFPGQGSQYVGMGGDLFEEFDDLTKKADEILGYSIKRLCLEDPDKKLHNTQFAQPALFVVNALSYHKIRQRPDEKPDFVAGHSLGEYNALLAAGGIDFETGLILVKKRGEIMSRASGGGMAAIIGLDKNTIENILKYNHFDAIDIANYNTPSQIVISGLKKDIKQVQSLFEEAEAKFIPLNVSAAFHSRYMQAAREEYEKYLRKFTFSELTIPVISNVNARLYIQADIIKNLANQLRSPVRWTDSIIYLITKGNMQFEEIGCGEVLTNLIHKIKKETPEKLINELEIENKATSDNHSTNKHVNSKLEATNINSNIQTLSDTQVQKKEPDEFLYDSINTNGFPLITAASLGCKEFKRDYNLKYAYTTGGMVRGIASTKLVARICNARMMGFYGTGGQSLDEIESAIHQIRENLDDGINFGMNLLNSPSEEQTVDLYLRLGVRIVETAAYIQISPALVKYRLKGIYREPNGMITVPNKLIAKLSRPEVADAFLSPATERIVSLLLNKGAITEEEANLSKSIPMADDICVEADSGGHTDQGIAFVLMPAMLKLRDTKMAEFGYQKKIRIGAAGGIGTPEAAAAAFILGADFILTGSINQCTVESGISNTVKEMLQGINVQDTDYAPAGDMFEFGSKVQVLKKGVFFPARANKLYELYRRYSSLDEIDEKTKQQLQEKFFKRSFDEIYEDVKLFHPPDIIEKAEKHPKQKMALIFRWYFGYSNQLAINGLEEKKVDFQVHCGPALGAFNQWVKGTKLQYWQDRHVDQIAEKIMHETAELLNSRFRSFMQKII